MPTAASAAATRSAVGGVGSRARSRTAAASFASFDRRIGKSTSAADVRVFSASRVITARVARTAARASSSVMADSSPRGDPQVDGYQGQDQAQDDPPRPPGRRGVLLGNVPTAVRASFGLGVNGPVAMRTRDGLVLVLIV